MDFTIWNYEGFKIRQRTTDNYYSAKDMCLVAGKQFGHWNGKEEREPYSRNKILKKLKLPLEEVIQIRAYHNGKHYRDSWVHPIMAKRLAEWVSPALANALEDRETLNIALEEVVNRVSKCKVLKTNQNNTIVQTVDDVELSLDLINTNVKNIEDNLNRLDTVISCLNICKEKNEQELYQNLLVYLEKLISNLDSRGKLAKVNLLKNGQYALNL